MATSRESLRNRPVFADDTAHHCVEILALGRELDEWAIWISNESPPWAAVRSLLANLLFSLKKEPGTQLVACVKIWHCNIANLVIFCTDTIATVACRSDKLCAGLLAGVKGAVHAMSKSWGRI